VRRLDVDRLALTVRSHSDAQYGGTFFFRGVSIAEVIAACAPPATADVALLHFANGMAVPLAFRDERVMARLDPFVARAMSPRRDGDLRAGEFPPRAGLPVGGEVSPTARNRLVVNEQPSPDNASSAPSRLSPWDYVDTLVGIEFVDGAAYDAQLEVSGSAAARAGGRLFRESCQYCHAARGVGGNLGWDFIEPDPIYSDAWFRHFRSMRDDESGYRDPATSLYAHARFRVPGTAGRLMPALRSLTAADARSLWQWIRAFAARPTPPYTPRR
jgi:mono/diheme cytochrome c family protein